VVYKTFEFNEDMLTELEITGGEEYYLVIADDYIIEFVVAEGLARKLDRDRMNSQIPSAKPGACFVNRSKRFVVGPPKGLPFIHKSG
jgi:spermidine/putrescine-binding protein